MADGAVEVRWTEDGQPKVARWRSEADLPPPSEDRLVLADDRTTADQALRHLRAGRALLYRGDFHNARQLLQALGRRVSREHKASRARSPLEAFRLQRQQRAREHELLNRLLVPLDGQYRVALRRGPDVREACEHVWGSPDAERTVVSLRELQGILGAEQWRQRGVEVPGLPGRLHPHYGVFSPTRGEYPELLLAAPAPTGKRVFDVGTGTGVLGLLLLARGAREVVATDQDVRAVRCAQENAARLGFSDRFRALEADLFPEGRADLVVFNPPWLPEPPRTRIDRAIYDPDGQVLQRFLAGLGEHLAPGGEGWLLISDLAELLGLRAPNALQTAIADAGLRVAWTHEARPRHPKAHDPKDPLHAARSQETTTLYALVTAR